MRVSFSFDVEYYTTPPEAGLDDMLKMLGEVMTAEKVTGSFFLIGERLRCLRDRGRRDVIDALLKHEIGSHVNMGSIHPTVTERMEHADWTDGVARMLADEVGGMREMSEILGVPVRTWARHGGSYCPQLIAALGKQGFQYASSPAELPKHHITWYCNAINFTECHVNFQENYFTRESFLEREKRFHAFYEEHKDWDWVGIFHSHPGRIQMAEFVCKNYYDGRNPQPEELRQAEVRKDYNFAALRENFAFHCRRLHEDPRFTSMTFAQMADEFRRQAESADAREIASLARQAADTKAPFWTDRFTAAEIVDLLARAYLHRARYGRLPESLPRRNVMGPSQIPLAMSTARKLAPEALMRVARGVDAAIALGGMAPSRLRCGEGTLASIGEVGLGSALAALGQALVARDPKATVETRPVNPYPVEGDEIALRAARFKNWNVHRKDLDMADIARFSALQSWTLKPAWPGEPPAFA